ncbi:hypothetical protein [Allokutzneria albata]|uniref:hypothetical protein n=1 Tax=Allokutzneria albata TaxID=211114 RepID=UPI0004C3F3B5|nr:hypothetical protein [Allokutzneria albata]
MDEVGVVVVVTGVPGSVVVVLGLVTVTGVLGLVVVGVTSGRVVTGGTRVVVGGTRVVVGVLITVKLALAVTF